MQPEEAQLVSRSQQGDRLAFNTIVERYQSQVFNVAARILGNRSTAEDVAQETFISAYRAIGSFRGGSLKAWLLRIASNASKDSLRALRRRPADSLEESLESPSFQPASAEATPEQQALQGELGEFIQSAILGLPEDQRIVLVLIDVQGFSYEETAEATGASMGTVKSRLSRARARLRDALMQQTELLPERFRHIQ